MIHACGCGEGFLTRESLGKHMANDCPNRGSALCSQHRAKIPHGEHIVANDGTRCPGYPEEVMP